MSAKRNGMKPPEDDDHLDEHPPGCDCDACEQQAEHDAELEPVEDTWGL